MSSEIILDFQVESIDEEVPPESSFILWIQTVLNHLCQVNVNVKEVSCKNKADPIELTVRIVDQEESANLNMRYCNKSHPTNVLSFMFKADLPFELCYLGDIVMCAPVIKREIREQGKEILAHWAHLTVHGVLHLLGYDHQIPVAALEMETLEKNILKQLGYLDPYLICYEGVL